MNHPSGKAQEALHCSTVSSGHDLEYAMHSELARLCLPAEYKDTARRLAWANSICALFLAVGLFGIRAPKIITKPLSKPDDVVPVLFVEPETAPPEDQAPEPDAPPPASPLEEAQAVPVVVVANTPAIAFAVPVKGATVLAPARFAAPPPLKTDVRQAPKITRYDPNTGGRSTPQPEYPIQALKRAYQGKVVIYFEVSETGSVTKAEVSESSGHTVLDDAALNVVKYRWRFPPGEFRRHTVQVDFQLK